MAKKLVGFFRADPDLPPEEQEQAIVDAVMKRFEEMGLFEDEKEENENEREQ